MPSPFSFFLFLLTTAPGLSFPRVFTVMSTVSNNGGPPFTLVKDLRVDISRGRFPGSSLKWVASSSNTNVTEVWKFTHRPSNSYSGMGLRIEGGDDTPRSALLADDHVAVDKELCNLVVRALTGEPAPPDTTSSSSNNNVEVVSWVDNLGRDLVKGGIKRTDAHRLNLLHRGAGILVRNSKGQVYVHQRAAHKRIFPSMFDMFVGGVSHYGEDSLTTARREVFEELGLGGPEAPYQFLFSCLVETDLNRCLVDVYEYVADDHEVVKLDQEEVQWGSYMDLSAIKDEVRSSGAKWVPDGLQVWNALINHWESVGEQKGAEPE